MAISTKIIKKRIRSIGNTRKITKAMEMVAAAKMRKAVNAVLSSRSYADIAWEMVSNLIQRVNPANQPILQQHEKIKKIGIILVTSNRGLCGGFNTQIITKALSYARSQNDEAIKDSILQEWLVLGRKGGEFLARSGRTVVAEFEKPDVIPSAAEVSALARMIIKDYTKGVYDKIFIAYTDFISVMMQKPRIKQLLPLQPIKDEQLGQVGQPEVPITAKDQEDFEYLFEPSPEAVLNLFLPQLVEIQLYQALLESTASEHSARMMAMKNATNAAGDMIDELTLIFNQARQAGITREIAEIVSGKAALE